MFLLFHGLFARVCFVLVWLLVVRFAVLVGLFVLVLLVVGFACDWLLMLRVAVLVGLVVGSVNSVGIVFLLLYWIVLMFALSSLLVFAVCFGYLGWWVLCGSV